MPSKIAKFFNYYNIEEQKLLVAKFKTTDKKELQKLTKQVVIDYITNNTKPEMYLDPDSEFKLARAQIIKAKAEFIAKKEELQTKKLDLETRILSRQVEYQDNFDAEPSNQAKSAIKKGIEQRDLTEQEYENVTKYITLKNHNFKWIATCDICKDGETYDTRHDAINEMIRHLTTEHTKKVMEIR